jgi:F-type H+-transporting ATPase subunit epsilon
MNSFTLHILAAERSFYEGECLSLVVPITDGSYGIQSKHQNMVAAIVPGILEYSLPDETRVTTCVSQGILVVADNDVKVLVDTIETPDEIDANRAKKLQRKQKKRYFRRRAFRNTKVLR